MGDLMAPTHRKKVVVAPLTEEELDSVTIVFHQFETGLREGTIYTKVRYMPDFNKKHMNYISVKTISGMGV